MSGYVHVQVHFGRLEEAERNCKAMLHKISQTEVLGKNDPRTVVVAEQLKNIYLTTGRSDQLSVLKAQFPEMDGLKANKRFADCMLET
jgi:hypothetical protein